MKYKALFRVLLKAIGVWIGANALEGIVSYLVTVFAYRMSPSWVDMNRYYIWSLIGPAFQLLIAFYLFFGGKWIVNKAIPGNRPYCHECGYDLTGAVGNICNECGTSFRPPDGISG